MYGKYIQHDANRRLRAMIYAYITNTAKTIDFNIYRANQFITSAEEYNKLKIYILPTDALIIEETQLLGNTINQVINEINDLRLRGINFTVLDNTQINNNNREIMSFIDFITNLNLGTQLKIGRPEVNVPIKFDKLYRMYLMGDTQRAIELSGLSRATFYRRLAKYEKEHGYIKRRNSKAIEYGKTLQNFKLDNRTLEQYPLLKL